MSATNPLPIGAANATTGAPTTITDQVVGAAQDLPDLINKASTFDPDTAAKWTGKALLASKTPWGTLLVPLVTYLASRYALGWDTNTCTLVAGVGVLVGAYIMRMVTELPITGLLRPATPSEAIAKVTQAAHAANS